jgi:hypothetical protein
MHHSVSFCHRRSYPVFEVVNVTSFYASGVRFLAFAMLYLRQSLSALFQQVLFSCHVLYSTISGTKRVTSVFL